LITAGQKPDGYMKTTGQKMEKWHKLL